VIFLFLSTDFWILKISAQSRQGTKQSNNHSSLRLRVLVREMQNSFGKVGNQTRKMPFFAQKTQKMAKNGPKTRKNVKNGRKRFNNRQNKKIDEDFAAEGTEVTNTANRNYQRPPR